jgi:hypothetical protein
MNSRNRLKIRVALETSWSERTCLIFNSDVPSANHCAQTAIVLQRIFDGEILMTRVRDGMFHFYNRIDGEREDFTADQFTAVEGDTHQLEYDDKIVGLADAMQYTNSQQVEHLAREFRVAYATILPRAEE